ncbi:hypothetical protein [Natronococcus roseus]|uniref:hypothetical protein n=1 Tax=Natronococcus roseus TaxID=1052014 RepID=UPI00374DF91A
MTDNNNTNNEHEEVTGDSEELRSELSEALGEGIFQKSAEANGEEEERPKTSEYDDGYIPARFRSGNRSTGERRARQSKDNDE